MQNTDYTYPGFDDHYPEWLEGIELGAVYQYEDSHSFRAGSYSGYNHWRNWLCTTILNISPREIWNNPEEHQDKPFYRLINFSDCEGIIGPAHSKELAKAFKEYQQIIDDSDSEEYNKKKYSEWRKAFEYAAQNGYVYFH